MGKRIAVFLVMLVLIAGLIAVAFTGLDVDLMIFKINIPSVQNGIIPGLDMSGGTIITYEAQAETVSRDQMDVVEAMLRQRVSMLGFTEASIYPAGNKRITIEIPNIHIRDTNDAAEMIGLTAQLEFRTVGDPLEEDYVEGEHKIWLTGDAVANARYRFGPDETGVSAYFVELEFKSEFEDIWVEATKFAARQPAGSNYIALYMDGKPVTDADGRPISPTVESRYAATGIGRECRVSFGSGGSTKNDAEFFTQIVNIGKLPFALSMEQLLVVGPTLGDTALQTSLIAGAIGLLLLILFMIFYYRLPGLMATIALLLYTAMIAIILALVKVNLSLPGIAGIILSIGMATDANIVIFERVKEELRSGKTVRSSVDSGFKRARTAIIDSNLTTMISGFVLLMFGTGPIKSFAQTLLIGVALSMFTALFVTQMLLKQMAGLGVVKLWYYGVREDRAEPAMQSNTFSFVKNFKFFGVPSLLICLFTVAALVLAPFGVTLFNFDIDFTGGTSFQIDIGRDVSRNDMDRVAEIVREASGLEPSAPQRVGNTQVLIKIPLIESETGASAGTAALSQAQQAVMDALGAEFPALDENKCEVGYVGSSVGADLRNAAIISVIVASVLILLYITVRFQFSSGLASIIAQLHDVAVLIAAYIILQIPINMTFIAVLLTTLGYQINATIILFDRVRENRKKMQRTSFRDIIDRSIKQTLSRNINTTLTTLLPVICIIAIGVPSVRNFALPIGIGLLAGAYSSITLSGSLWHKIAGADERATKKLDFKTK
jgi:SecD/SecF fusion protein